MKKIISYLILIVIASSAAAQQKEVLLGKGMVEIQSGKAMDFLKGLYVYPGYEIHIVCTGQVRRNWWIEKGEDCFLFFCDDWEVVHNNFTTPDISKLEFGIYENDLLVPGSALNLGSDGQFPIPSGIKFDRKFQFKAWFNDAAIDRSKSDGAYNVEVYVNLGQRLKDFVTFLSGKGSNLSFSDINNIDVLDPFVMNQAPVEVAQALGADIAKYPEINGEEKRSILEYVHKKLDNTNPVVSLTLAKIYIDQEDLNSAELLLKEAVKNINNKDAAPQLLGEAYLLMGKKYDVHSLGLEKGYSSKASVYYGMAVDNYMKAGLFEKAAEAIRLQARIERSANNENSLDKSTELLKKAEKLITPPALAKGSSGYGLINQYGDFLLKPTMELIKLPIGNLIPARKNNKWGYINKLGDQLIDFKFENAWWFSEGLGRVKENGKYHYIDNEGKNPKPGIEYKWAGDFVGNFSLVLNTESNFQVINKKFEVLFDVPQMFLWGSYGLNEMERKETNPQYGGFVLKNVPLEKLLAKIDSLDNLQTFTRFVQVNSYIISVAAAFQTSDYALYSQQTTNGNFISGIMDKQGNIRVPASDAWTSISLNGDIFFFWNKDKTLKILDHNLNDWKYQMVGPAMYIGPLGGGYFSYGPKPDDKKAGLLDSKGRIITQPIFDIGNGWLGGYADYIACRTGNDVKVFKEGTEILTMQLQGADQFSINAISHPTMPNYLGRTRMLFTGYSIKDDKLSPSLEAIFDDKGNIIVGNYKSIIVGPPGFTDVYIVTKEVDGKDKTGIYVEGKGEIVSPQYDNIMWTRNMDLLAVEKDDKYGVIDPSGNTLLEPNFDFPEEIGTNLIQAYWQDSALLLDRESKKLLYKGKDEISGIPYIDGVKIADLPFLLENRLVKYQTSKFSIMQYSNDFVQVAVNDKWEIKSADQSRKLINEAFDTIFLYKGYFVCGNRINPPNKSREYDYKIFSTLGKQVLDFPVTNFYFDNTDNSYQYIDTKDNFILTLGDEKIFQGKLKRGNKVEPGTYFPFESDRYTISGASLFDGKTEILESIYDLTKFANQLRLKGERNYYIINIQNHQVRTVPVSAIYNSDL